tara:strand:+ start:88 stop:975 length:888 start_codon:yes stop_codon:yes gene_type:complete
MNGGKKKRRKTQKNKRRKHRKGGMNLREKLAKRGIQIPIGKQLPFSKDNQPKEGDNVRVHGEKGWTVTVVMPRAAMVCRTDQIKSSEFGKICGGNSEKTVRYENMTKRGSLGQLGLRGGRKKRRKSRKKSKKKRRKTKRRMKGGSGKGLLASPACSGFNCDLPTNVGEIYTHYPNNTNPFLPDPMSLNSNLTAKALDTPKRLVGKKGGRRKRRGRKNMKGGFFFDDWGLGDGLLAYYKGTNAALNTKHLYAGNKPEVSATPSDQPELLKKPYVGRTSPNLGSFYEQGSNTAASYS